MEFETQAIHAGQEPDPEFGAVMTPIYQTSTYMQDGVGKARQGYEYSRTKNPTRAALEKCLAELEGAESPLQFIPGDEGAQLPDAQDQRHPKGQGVEQRLPRQECGVWWTLCMIYHWALLGPVVRGTQGDEPESTAEWRDARRTDEQLAGVSSRGLVR